MSVEERAARLAAELDADEAAIREDLENLLAYQVPVAEAEESLRRKYGTEGEDGPEPSVDIAEITAGMRRVSVTVAVLGTNTRTISVDGEARELTEGMIADETGRMPYTAWEPVDFEPGDAVTIDGAQVREWNGRLELQFGEGTRIAPAEDAPAVDVSPDGVMRIADIEVGDRALVVEGRILEAESRTIDGRDGPTDIFSGVIADESGRLPFTDWERRAAIVAGETVRTEQVSVREFRGVPSLNFGESVRIESIDKQIDVSQEPDPKPLGAALADGGGFDVLVTGFIVDLREGSGLIERCPECRRRVRGGRCSTHGPVDGEPELRAMAIIDDGTGTATVILDADQTADIYGGSIEDAIAAAREAMDQNVITSTLRSVLIGEYVRVRGHLSVDEYGGTLDAMRFETVTESPETAATALLAEVDG